MTDETLTDAERRDLIAQLLEDHKRTYTMPRADARMVREIIEDELDELGYTYPTRTWFRGY